MRLTMGVMNFAGAVMMTITQGIGSHTDQAVASATGYTTTAAALLVSNLLTSIVAREVTTGQPGHH